MSHPVRLFAIASLLATAAATPGVALDAGGPYVYVPNRASADVAVIDTRTDRLVTRIPVGNVPHQVSVSDVVGQAGRQQHRR